jgi:methylenetetrahydrofolate reductase (NADPH)
MDAVAGDAAAELRVSTDMIARVVRDVRPYCAGIHLMTMGWEQRIPEILAAAGVQR